MIDLIGDGRGLVQSYLLCLGPDHRRLMGPAYGRGGSGDPVANEGCHCMPGWGRV